jgi:cation transport ATPase
VGRTGRGVPVNGTPLAFTVAAALYTGFQWTIRLLVYPQFAEVPVAAFVAYERRHQDRVSIAVGPLFLALGVTAVLLFALPPDGVSRWWGVATGACVAAVLGLTALLAVPLHTALSKGFDERTYRRLMRVDTLRLVAATAATALGVWVTAVVA